jgi:hypothetical protein
MRTPVRLSSVVLLLLSLIPWPGRAVAPAVPEASDPAAIVAARAQQRKLPEIVPDQVLVRFKDSVTVSAEALFRRGLSFRDGTADRSSSLDLLFRELGVREVRPVFRDSAAALVTVAELRRRDALELLAAVSTSPERARRVGGPAAPELFHVYRLDLGPGVDPMAASAALRRDPHVVYAEPNGVSFTQALPNDPLLDPTGQDGFHAGTWQQLYPDLWGLKRIGWGDVWRNRTTLWPDPKRRGGGGITVAVVDSGVDVQHPDLAANVWRDAQGRPGRDTVDVPDSFWLDLEDYGYGPTPGEDYRKPDYDPADRFGHGTHVAGTIAAVADNREGIAGIAWGSRLMAVRAGFTLDDTENEIQAATGVLLDDNIAAAIRWAAANGADVINMSFGGSVPSETVSLALDRAHALGAVLVAAAGNSGSDVADQFPASHRHVISVAATQTGDRRIYFSNWGTGIDIAAPGSDVVSLRARGTQVSDGVGAGPLQRYIRLSGTSMAAPHVSGAVALVLSAFPDLNTQEAAGRLVGTADPVSGSVFRHGRHLALGSGRLNVLRALTAAAGPAIVLRSWGGFSDIEGDGDGSAEPGEYVWVGLTFDNVWRTGRDVSLTLVAGPEATVVQGGSLQVGRWLRGEAQTLSARLKIGGSVPWGREGVFRLEARGGVHQDLDLPLVLRGPAAKAGWPVRGVRSGDGMITSSALADLDGDGDREVISVSAEGDVFVRDPDGSILPGWPRHVDYFIDQSSPLIEDLDRDGDLEIVLIQHKRIHVFDVQGRELSGWPQAVSDYVSCSPAAGDVDGDGDLEIVALSGDGLLVAFDAAGRLLPGWPQDVGSESNTSPVLVDLDADGSGLEILAAGYQGPLYAFRGDGTRVGGHWPVEMTDWGPSSPAVGDLEGDGEIDIIGVDARGYVYRIDRRGRKQLLRRVPGTYTFSSPALGDLDGDGSQEIVLGSGLSDGSGYISVLDAEGRLLPGWPVATGDLVAASPSLADVDGDGRPEVIVPDLSGELWLLHADGRPAGGWPIDVDGLTLSSPVVADLDGDGTPEIVQGLWTLGFVQGTVLMNHTLEFGEGTGASWPTYKGDSRRTGEWRP